jgi:hypothetical protein
MEVVIQLKLKVKTRRKRTVEQATKGEYVLKVPSWRSPQTQKRALYFLTSPSVERLRRNAQVPGMI